jgi:hypothetical protein
VDEWTLARSLLSAAIDESDPDAQDMADLLDRIAGAWESAQQGLAEARAGHGTELDDL